ncbi:tetratricopeptide repeat protein, partial [Pseudanabaena galeata UHCC 0370]
YQRASELFEHAILLDDKNFIVINSYANALVRQGKYQRASELFEHAILLDDKNFIVINSYANALVRQGKYQRASELFDRCLELEPDDFRTLNSYAISLVQQGEYQRASELFEYSLQLEPNNIPTLNSYANALVEQCKYQRASELFEQCLKLEPNNLRTLNSYANALVKQEEYQRASELFEYSLQLEPNNIPTLNSYASSLVQQGEYQQASELFEYSLQLEPNNIPTLNSYANALVEQGEYQYANELFEQCLQLDRNDVRTLTSYANSLVQQRLFQRASELFKQCLKLEPNNFRVLTSFANTLVEQGEYQQANELFEQCLQLDKNDILTLNSYANALVKQGEYQTANELFELSLKSDKSNIPTLVSYANALVLQRQYQRASDFFEQCVQLDRNDVRTLNSYANALVQSCSWLRLIELCPNDSYARLQYAKQLEAEENIMEALTQLLAIDLDTQKTYHANIIRLNLGRLYYRLGQFDLGKQFFDEAIANSEDQDKSTLYAARSLLATNPNSQEAITLLRQIQEDSPRYAEAMKAIALNADEETSYELFGADEEQIDDIEMLYRAMYHKIGNEIAVLRSISYRLLRRMEGEHPLVKEIVNDLEKLQQGIASQRANEKAAIAGIAHSNYKQLIEIVSKTAHDISDEVNNQLAVIESKTRRAMRKLTAEDPQYQQFEKLLLQLKITQTALNDLKSINEGKTIRRDRFLVHRLFEKWEPENWTSQPRIDGVRIRLDIRNPDSEFNGDEEKIKSILNELVENSLKHNRGNSNLSIRIYSSDLLNPSDISSPTIPGDRKFLYIEFADNGQGVPNDKKEWIFQPLKTTSPEDKGSGLGLFIARKTIKKMGGQIREVGEADKGVKFQIYLPYLCANSL